MLERVPLLEKSLHDYADVVAPGTIERIEALAKPLQGARVLHVNATAYGGGVAELLATHVPLLRDIGMEAEWQVIRGSDEFFQITKAVHNGLQGADVEWTSAMEHEYLERVLSNALEVCVLHCGCPLDVGALESVVHRLGDLEELVAAADHLPLGLHA